MSRVSRAAGDEGVEPVVLELQVGPREDEVVAAGPGGTSRADAVDQEQRQCPDPPPRQSLETVWTSSHPSPSSPRLRARGNQS